MIPTAVILRSNLPLLWPLLLFCFMWILVSKIREAKRESVEPVGNIPYRIVMLLCCVMFLGVPTWILFSVASNTLLVAESNSTVRFLTITPISSGWARGPIRRVSDPVTIARVVSLERTFVTHWPSHEYGEEGYRVAFHRKPDGPASMVLEVFKDTSRRTNQYVIKIGFSENLPIVHRKLGLSDFASKPFYESIDALYRR